MSIKKLSKTAFNNFVDSLIEKSKVIGVQAKGDKFDFAPLSCSQEFRLDYDVTLQPPKKYFQPPVETLITFDKSGSCRSVYDCEPFILIGVHPYDMIAINQMDKIFARDNVDVHYFARRKNVTIIASDIITASENIFASCMGTATVKEGYDILLTDIGNSYIIEAATEKGEQLVKIADKTEDAADNDLDKRREVWQNNEKNLNKHQLKCSPQKLPELLENAYDHEVWEEKAKTCFSCGSCNQVCPTCYCFNVRDDVNWDLQSGSRGRAWDCCLIDGFTKVAGDHEFRKKRADRFRHRLYRKAKYVPQKIDGQIACVGCGRCISACLPDIANPVNIYNRLLEDINV